MMNAGARRDRFVVGLGRKTVAVCYLFAMSTAALVVLALSGTAHANLLTNGDFATGDLTGWSASGNVLAIPESAYGGCCGTTNYTPGAYVGSFGAANMPDNGVLAQSFPTVVGLGYVVSFEYGAVGFSLPQSMDLSIASGAATVGASLTATGTNDFDTLFTTYSYTFTAEATTTTLTFTDTSSVTDNVDGLVELVSADVAPTNEVPEPSSLALIGVGLMGWAFAGWLQRSASVRANGGRLRLDPFGGRKQLVNGAFG